MIKYLYNHGDKALGLKIYGIGAAQNVDNAGETLLIEGLNTSLLRGVRDEHDQDNFFHKVGAITYSKKIFKKEECENEKQLRCWNYAQVPFLYAEAELADGEGHPNAQSAAALIKFTNAGDKGVTVGFSVDDGTTERRNEAGHIDERGKLLAKTVSTDLALTVKPCNPKCRVWMENDLAKSDANMKAPARYFEALKKSQSTSSINEIYGDKLKLYYMMDKLKKSYEEYASSQASIRCTQCGSGVLFFKGSVPNRCDRCKQSYNLSDIWSAVRSK